MAVIRLAGFAGANRRVHPQLLPDIIGASSFNQKPGRGDLRAWQEPVAVATAPAGSKTIYRMGRTVRTDVDYWAAWPGHVYPVISFDPDDSDETTFYVGDGEPKMTKLAWQIQAGDPPYPRATYDVNTPAIVKFGITPPTTAASVTPMSMSGGVSANPRYFTYTYVNTFGWESQAAPVASDMATASNNNPLYWDLTFPAPPTGNLISKIRIYTALGTVTGDSGFFFIAEINTGGASTNYRFNNPALSGAGVTVFGEELVTQRWAPPPANLSYMIPMWNGMLAGIADGAVRFSESYVPYAWPLTYDLVPPDSRPVALAVFGQNLLVLTDGRPVLVAGSTPDALDSQMLEIPQACVAARSAVSFGNGVAWASNDGLCWYGTNGGKILTAGIMSRDDWQALYPETIVGCNYDGLYFGSYSNDGVTRKGFILDVNDPQGIYFLDRGYEAMYFDKITDSLFVLDGTEIKKWESSNRRWSDTPSVRMEASFTSKRFKLPRDVLAFSCAQVTGEGPCTLKIRAFVETEEKATAIYSATNSKWVSWSGYAEEKGGADSPIEYWVEYIVEVPDNKAFRLPGGFRASEWQVVVITSESVQSVVLAHSFSELAQA